MGMHLHKEPNVIPLYGYPDQLANVGLTAGPGTFAVAAGGLPVCRKGDGTWSALPLSIPVHVTAHPTDPSHLVVSIPLPNEATLGLRDAWVTYWQED